MLLLVAGGAIAGMAVAAAVAGLLHRGSSAALSVQSATVSVPAAQFGCGADVHVTGAVATNGGAGTLDFTWRRNGADVAGLQHLQVSGGSRVTLPDLEIPISGTGRQGFIITLEIVGPARLAPVQAEFVDDCR